MERKCSQSENVTLYAKVKAGFTLQGTSLNKWCIQNNIKRQNAALALKGVWCGPKSAKLRDKLIADSGVSGGLNGFE